MTEQDNKLFSFFSDLPYFSQNDTEEQRSFALYCDSLLKNQSYSDINVKDKNNDTFLHALGSHVLKENCFIMKYVLTLLDLGADISSRNSQNALPLSSEKMNTLYKKIGELNTDNFYRITKNFHPNTKNVFFHEMCTKKLFRVTTEQITPFLEENSMYSYTNYIIGIFSCDFLTEIVKKQTSLDKVLDERFRLCTALPLSPKDNVNLLVRLFKDLPDNFYENEKSMQLTKHNLKSFLETATLEYNYDLVHLLSISTMAKYGFYYDNEISNTFIHHIVHRLISQGIDFDKTNILSHNTKQVVFSDLHSPSHPLIILYKSIKFKYDLEEQLSEKKFNNRKTNRKHKV